ncbi:MAG: hypothetical protein WC539_08890 [Nitrospirota bacterium]
MLYTSLLIIHVLAVILWIGGLAFIATVIFPMVYQAQGVHQKVLLFQRVEQGYSVISKWLVNIAGLTGVWILYKKFGFGILLQNRGIGIVIMLIVWILYTLLTMLQRPVFAKLFAEAENIDIEQMFRLVHALYWAVLAVSFLAVAGGIWFGHGQEAYGARYVQ